jgi:hypothetical protein
MAHEKTPWGFAVRGRRKKIARFVVRPTTASIGDPLAGPLKGPQRLGALQQQHYFEANCCSVSMTARVSA